MSLVYAQGGRMGDEAGGVVQPNQFERQGAVYTKRRPCFVWFRGDLYVIGYYTRPVVRHALDSGQWRLAGIRRPALKLVVVPGASTGGSSGPCLAAITFLHKVGNIVLAESNFSNVVDVGDLTGEGRSWSNIDASSAEDRVTHVRGYVSMNGDDFRAAWEAPYGVTGYVENIRTAQLTYAGLDLFQHGIPPATKFGHSWAGRMWYANSTEHPYRVWYSLPGQPQYVGNAAFRDTLDKEPITAIWKGRNELLVFCLRASYMIRQFGSGTDDFIMEKLDSDVGCITHFGIQEIHNKLWFPSEDGPWIYDGGFRYLGKEIQPLWRDDYQRDREAFLDGFAMHDRISKVYLFVTRRYDREEFENTGIEPGTVIYCGYYGAFEPSMAGEQRHPEWTLDFKHRFDSSGFYDDRGELVVGSCDGKVRRQDWTDTEDDGDLLRKEAIVRTGHHLFFEPGDDLEGGKHLAQLWAYVESELSDWTIHAIGGDEQAWKGELPDNDMWFWKADVPASQKTETRVVRGSRTRQRTLDLLYVPATVHYFVPERVTGRGFTFEIRAIGARGLEYRGLGGLWGPGATARGVEEPTNFRLTVEWSLDESTWNEGDVLVESALGQVTVYFRVTVDYEYGTAAFPVQVSFDFEPTTFLSDYDDSVSVPAAATPTGLSAEGSLFPVPGAYTLVVTGVDSNGAVQRRPVRRRITLVSIGT